MKKSTVTVIAMVLIAVLAVVFLISQSNTYDPPRHLTWDAYNYNQTFGEYQMDSTNVWFSVYEVVDTGYVKLGATQEFTYDLLANNPGLYNNQNHTWVITAWDDIVGEESFYSESVSKFLPSPPIETVTNPRIVQ